MLSSTCQISPEGNIYECRSTKHHLKAKELTKLLFNIEGTSETLEDMGWLRLSEGVLMSLPMMFGDIRCTQSQLNYVYELFMNETDEYIKYNLEGCLSVLKLEIQL